MLEEPPPLEDVPRCRNNSRHQPRSRQPCDEEPLHDPCGMFSPYSHLEAENPFLQTVRQGLYL